MPDIMDLKPEEISTKISKGEISICIVGLGSMGLPAACLFAEAGAKVIGVDVDRCVVEKVNKGKSPLTEPGLENLIKNFVGKGQLQATDDAKDAASKSDIAIIIVPTMIDKLKRPDYSIVEKACKNIGQGIKKGALIIFESTVGPGVTETVVKKELEEASGLKADVDFGLAYSPIRATVGRTLKDIMNYPRIVGANDKRSLEAAAAVLSTIAKGGIIRTRDIKTAEAVKLFENVYRDVNIALANELAVFCEAAGIDYFECMNAAITQPYCHLHIPSTGVGGSCIPVNPYFLIEESEDLGVKPQMVRLARRVNDAMPSHMLRLIESAAKTCKKSLKRTRIAVLGISYRANVKEPRYSVVKDLVNLLKKRGVRVAVYDPYFTTEELKELGYDGYGRLERVVENVDCIVIAVGHDEFKRLNLKNLKRLTRKPAAIIDGGNTLNPSEVEAAGFIYRGLGHGSMRK